MKKWVVYKHTSPSGKVYIGISSNVKHRWRGDGSGYKGSTRMWYAIKKYRFDNFRHDILYKGLTKAEAEKKEIELIKQYKATDARFGYNLQQGGKIRLLTDNFIQMDAIDFLKTQDLSRFDVIHASPPCQKFSRVQSLGKARNGIYKEHPDLITPTRELLQATGKPYVIENVMGAPLINPIVLCGSMFKGLKVYRHRQFESNMPLYAPKHKPHNDKTPSVGNGISPKGFISVCGTGGVKGMTSKEILEYWSMAMGIDWMARKELAQAIPPAYTEWIGRQLAMQLMLAS